MLQPLSQWRDQDQPSLPRGLYPSRQTRRLSPALPITIAAINSSKRMARRSGPRHRSLSVLSNLLLTRQGIRWALGRVLTPPEIQSDDLISTGGTPN